MADPDINVTWPPATNGASVGPGFHGQAHRLPGGRPRRCPIHEQGPGRSRGEQPEPGGVGAVGRVHRADRLDQELRGVHRRGPGPQGRGPGGPGWRQARPGRGVSRLAYAKDSRIRDLCAGVYQEVSGSAPQIKAIHAGLECGLLKEKLPETDMISFGPNLYNVHTPQEHLSIKSVANTWKFLTSVLAKLKIRGDDMKEAGKKTGLSKNSYGGCQGSDYVPYVPTTEVMPEITGYSILMGILFALLFAAANTYLGLKVGMTISAGIPGAILAIGLLRKAIQAEQHPGSEHGRIPGRDGRVHRGRNHLCPPGPDPPGLRPEHHDHRHRHRHRRPHGGLLHHPGAEVPHRRGTRHAHLP